MKSYLNVAELVQKNEDGTISVPFEVSVRLVRSRVLKAVVKIEYAGIIINDIYVFESRGRTSIEFPYKTFTDKQGTEKRATVAAPCVPEISRTFNQAILEAYKQACNDAMMKEVA